MGEELSPSTHNMEVPNVTRKDYQLLAVDDGFLSLLDDNGDTRDDLKCPEGDIGTEIMTAMENDRDLLVTCLSAVGEEMVIATKTNTAVDKLITQMALERKKATRYPRDNFFLSRDFYA